VSIIEISDLHQRVAGEACEWSARIEGLPPGLGEDRLWFRFPAQYAPWLRSGAEPALAALLPIAMLLHRPLQAQGRASWRFLSGCGQIMTLYSSWDSRLRPVQIRVADGTSEGGAREAIGAFFTGGVDSFYTLLQNLERERGENRIRHVIFIRGYADCPLDELRLCENLSARLRQAAAGYGAELVVAETNLKAFTPPPGTSWDWYAGSQLAAPGLCLERGFRRLHIPAGDTYATQAPWGSHPLVDPSWSTDGLEFRHDGCEAVRSQKLEWLVTHFPGVLAHLRVCGYDVSGVHNCGRCEKCLRTMIGLAALGVAPPPGLFATALDLDRVRQLDGGDRVAGYYLQDNLRLLETTGKAPEVEQAVRYAMRSSGRRWLLRLLRNAAREVDRRYMGSRARGWALRQAGGDSASQAELRLTPGKWVLRQAWQSARAGSGRKSGDGSASAEREVG